MAIYPEKIRKIKYGRKEKTILVRMDADVAQALKDFAEANFISRTVLVREILNKFLRDKGFEFTFHGVEKAMRNLRGEALAQEINWDIEHEDRDLIIIEEEEEEPKKDEEKNTVQE